MNLRTISELKASARGHLTGNYSQCVLIVLLFLIISSLVNLISTGSFAPSSLIANLLIVIVSIICSTIPFLLKAGLYHFFIKICCNAEYKIQDVICAFQINGKRNFLYALLILIVENICIVPFVISASSSITIAEKEILFDYDKLITSLIILAIGLLIYGYIRLLLSQVMFLMFDFPEKSIKELIALSVYLMKGQKLRYIWIIVTFLPLEILGYLSCGVGLFWVLPYKYSTLACYYLDLTNNKTNC